MWLFLGGYIIGGILGFLLCALLTCNAIQEAQFNEQCAKDYIKVLESQREQN